MWLQKNRIQQNLISQAFLYLKSPTLPTSAYPYKIAELYSVLHSSKSLSKSFYIFEAFCLQWTVSPFLPAPQHTASHRLWRPAFERHVEVGLIWPFSSQYLISFVRTSSNLRYSCYCLIFKEVLYKQGTFTVNTFNPVELCLSTLWKSICLHKNSYPSAGSLMAIYPHREQAQTRTIW